MLHSAKVMGFIPTKNPKLARPFYENVLGLRFVSEDQYALAFDANGIRLRVTTVPDFEPFPFTVFGWEVSQIESVVSGLESKGVKFERYSFLEQDKLGIWSAPDGAARVAWFKDPEGNLLSVAEF